MTALLIGLMSLAVFGVIAWALARPPVVPVDRRGIETALLQAQLAEIDRAEAEGSLDKDAAAMARLEVKRRVLQAARRAETPPAAASREKTGASRGWVMASALAVFAAALLYGIRGAPGLPAAPQPASELGGADVALPDLGGDAGTWFDQGQKLLRAGKARGALHAFQKAAAIDPQNPDPWIAQGEALLAMTGGLVVPAAELAFHEAETRASGNPASGFYAGLKLLQDGDALGAKRRWQAVLDAAPQDAPYRDHVKRALNDAARQLGEAAPYPDLAGPRAPNIDPEAMEAVAKMSPEEQQAFIRQMIGRMASRLGDDADSVDGWVKVALAYERLGDKTAALAALDHALPFAKGEMKTEIEAFKKKLQAENS